MRRHLPYQASCMFPFVLLALALCGENSLQHLLFRLQGWKILPGPNLVTTYLPSVGT
jgi:hypothetical protein